MYVPFNSDKFFTRMYIYSPAGRILLLVKESSHLCFHELQRVSRVVDHVLDGLRDGPAQGMDTGVNHQPAGAEHVHAQMTVPT